MWWGHVVCCGDMYFVVGVCSTLWGITNVVGA